MFSVMRIGESALYAFRVGLQVTSNNIANADTPDYSRQEVILQENQTGIRIKEGILGTGVKVARIISLRDNSLINDLHTKTGDYYDYATRRPLIDELESIFNNDEDFGLNAVMDKFWSAWGDLANRPDGAGERSAVLETGATLANYFQDINGQLEIKKTNLTTQLDAGVTRINELVESIAAANERIYHMELTGAEASEARDQRDGLVKELATYVGVNYYEDEDGMLSISLSNGKTLVNKLTTFQMEFDSSGAITINSDGADITSQIQGGQMGAWIEIRDVVIEQYQANLNELAKGVISAVNKVHQNGVGLEALTEVTGSTIVTDADVPLASAASGIDFYDEIQDGYFKVFVYDSNGDVVSHRIDVTTNTSLNDVIAQLNNITGVTAVQNDTGKLNISSNLGYSFAFGEVDTEQSNMLMALGVNTFFSGYNAGDMAVNYEVASNQNKVNAGIVDPKTGNIDPGDNKMALMIEDVQNQKLDFQKYTYIRDQAPGVETVTTTLTDYLGAMLSELGVIQNDYAANEDYNDLMVTQVQDLIAEKSGVNLDEEMLNLLMYQRAYQGAARIITTADEMLQTLLQM